MFSQHEIQTLNSCISTYIELANTQKYNITLGTKDCVLLNDIYESKINDCYAIQLKLNELIVADEPITYTFSSKDLKKI